MSKFQAKAGAGGRAGPKAAKSGKNLIFAASAVHARLRALYEAAARDEEDQPEYGWWAPALKFEWEGARNGGNGTKWVTVTYTNETGVSGRLQMKFNGERHSGQIMPLSEEELAKLVATMKSDGQRDFKVRDRKPTIQIQRWAAAVKTEADGVTLTTGPDGEPLLPDEKYRSQYFGAAELVNHAFLAEVQRRRALGARLAALAVEKRKGKGVMTPVADVLAAFRDEAGASPKDVIFAAPEVQAMRAKYGAPEIAALTQGALATPVDKTAELVQTRISSDAKKNAGANLPNPMTRIGMEFDKVTYVAGFQIYDMDSPFTDEHGKKQFEVAKDENGEVASADNIHRVVRPGSKIDGIVCLDAVCISSMGISIPTKTTVLVVGAPPARAGHGVADLYGDEDEGDEGDGNGGEAGGVPGAAGGVPEAAGGVPGAAGGPDEDEKAPEQPAAKTPPKVQPRPSQQPKPTPKLAPKAPQPQLDLNALADELANLGE